MRLAPDAVCMASSAPNPYGQPTVPLSATAAANIYYSDYDQLAGHQAPAATIKSSAAAATIETIDQLSQQPTPRPNPHHQTSVDATPRAITHLSSSSLGSYDNYISGMSSDSELTTASTTARHHHRPYSSQSRVYHAHPVPRNPQAASSARLSHFSSGSAANVQATPQHSGAYSVRQQPQPQPQQLVNNNQASSLPSHQAPMSSQKSGSGRQLPQRPFKQSLSIDQHSLDNHYSHGQIGTHHHSPAQQQLTPSAMGMHRNIADPLGAAYQQKSYPTAAPSHHHFESTSSLFNESTSQRNIRYEMSLMEKQAANMSLYEAGGEHCSMAELPPTGQLRSSSAASRHMPSTSLIDQLQQQQQQQSHHQHQFDHYHHSQDPYASPTQSSSHHQRQKASSSSEWLPPIGGASNQVMSHGRGSGNQFKQTMSIDHYSAVRHQQQQQRHYSPARQLASAEQYHSLGSYAGHSTSQQSMMGPASGGGYDPSALNPAQDCYIGSTSADVGGNQDQVSMMKYHHYQPQAMPLNSLHHQATSSLDQQSKPTGVYEKSDSVGSGGLKSINQHQHPSGNRPNLQHQPSSSSSNSNLSGSFNTNNVETNLTNLDSRPTGSNSEHQKSASSASSHYQQSPQHSKIHSNTRHQTGTRQDLLRRGYTSMAAPSSIYGNDFGGSQSALSESGDLSLSQASHSGQASSKRAGLRAVSPSLALEASSSAGPLYQHQHNQHQQQQQQQYQHHQHHHQHHHSASSAQGLRETAGIRSESSTGLPNGPGGSSALAKKSNSATQLSMTGTKKRLGFRKKQVTSFSVHRSEEVAPLEARHLVKQGSSVSEGDSSLSGDSSSRSWSNSNFKQHTSEELGPMSFIDGLGKGQMISRQGLASPYLGDIQLSLCDRRGNLEVEVIRARNLQAKTNKIQPLTYVKLYLVKNRKCLAKAKTTLSNKRTLNPLFQQQLTFHEDYHGCILQSIVWGNFGKMDKKNFMGIAQISIDDLELSDTVIKSFTNTQNS